MGAVVMQMKYGTRVTYAKSNGVVATKMFSGDSHCADAVAFVRGSVIGFYPYHKMEPTAEKA